MNGLWNCGQVYLQKRTQRGWIAYIFWNWLISVWCDRPLFLFWCDISWYDKQKLLPIGLPIPISGSIDFWQKFKDEIAYMKEVSHIHTPSCYSQPENITVHDTASFKVCFWFSNLTRVPLFTWMDPLWFYVF